jgi:hypothetical protein
MGIIFALFAAAPAMAQSAAPVFPGAFTPQQLINKPIDMSKVVAPFPQANNPSGLSRFFHGFTLSNIFPKILQTSAAPRSTTSPFPLPSTFPSTKYPNALPPPTFPKK